MSDWNRQIIDEFRANAGEVTTAGFGRSLILVHHIGARTGAERVTPLRSLPDGNGTWVVVASKQGDPVNPDWYHNMKAEPAISIETPDNGTVPVHAKLLTGESRELAWREFTAANPVFVDYQEKTERTFPIFALRKRE